MPIWYVIVRRDNGYPLLIYEEARRDIAISIAKQNKDYGVVAVNPIPWPKNEN